jgi:hypothetical protein
LLIIAGKELPSSRLWFLGGFAWRTPTSGDGDAWRTPTSGDGDAWGLDCFSFFGSKVVCVNRKALSVDRRSPRTRMEWAFLKFVPFYYIEKFGVFLTPPPY